MLSGEENLASDALGARLRLVGGCQSVIFCLFSGSRGLLCRGHRLPHCRHCAAQQPNGPGVVYGANLNLLCNYFLGKPLRLNFAAFCSWLVGAGWCLTASTCSPLTCGEMLLSISPCKPPVPPPCQPGEWDRGSAPPALLVARVCSTLPAWLR